ncbi:MAG: hypothetical protein DRJ69_00840 [Thermoprotei archaeon]|nr:MAG: hypothetical protein DRJ69_00840 [Thermoprotei archaeon]
MGPYAGFIAALIGGLIGMFLAPAAFPLGIIDVFLCSALLGLCWGWAACGNRKECVVAFTAWWIAWLIIANIYPYIWPGPAAGYTPAVEPQYALSWYYSYVGFILYLIIGRTKVHEWTKSPRRSVQLLGFFLLCYIAWSCWQVPWKVPYIAILYYPNWMIIADNFLGLAVYGVPMLVIETVISALIVTGLRKSKMLVVPRSCVGEIE